MDDFRNIKIKYDPTRGCGKRKPLEKENAFVRTRI